MSAYDLLVVGGGIAGMAAARRARDLGARVQVLEAGARAGGLLGTEHLDGCVVDRGPDSILTTKPAAIATALELGLADEVLRTNPERRGAYVLCRGRMERIPAGFHVVAPADLRALWRSPVLTLAGKVRASLEVLRRAPGQAPEDESLADFVRRHHGDEVLARLAQPIAGGIYGAAPHRLGLGSTMPRFRDVERAHGSVTRGLSRSAGAPSAGARYGAFINFRRGMATLPDAMAAELGERVWTGVGVTGIRRGGDKWVVATEGRGLLEARRLVLACGARRIADWIAPLDAESAAHLRAIAFGSAAIVTLLYERRAIQRPLDAAGLVVPAIEGRAMLASTWSSEKWPGRAPEDRALLRVFLGGHTNEDLVHDASERRLARLAHDEIASVLGIEDAPLRTIVDRYVDVMPRYEVGHRTRMHTLDARLARLGGLAVAGSFHHGVGIPDTIADGTRAAETVLDSPARGWALGDAGRV